MQLSAPVAADRVAAMDNALVRLVWQRALHRCEYCQIPQEHDLVPFEIDHIIAACHGGPTNAANLALACFLWIEQA